MWKSERKSIGTPENYTIAYRTSIYLTMTMEFVRWAGGGRAAKKNHDSWKSELIFPCDFCHAELQHWKNSWNPAAQNSTDRTCTTQMFVLELSTDVFPLKKLQDNVCFFNIPSTVVVLLFSFVYFFALLGNLRVISPQALKVHINEPTREFWSKLQPSEPWKLGLRLGLVCGVQKGSTFPDRVSKQNQGGSQSKAELDWRSTAALTWHEL